MKHFEKTIKNLQIKQNLVLTIRFLMIAAMLIFLVFDIFFIVFAAISESHSGELFLFAISLKIFLALSLIYLILILSRKFLNRFAAAKYLDRFNADKAETYQNALELYRESGKADAKILQLIFERADKKTENQKIRANYLILKPFLIPFVTIILANAILFGWQKTEFLSAYDFFRLKKLPAVRHKNFVEVSPGNVSLLRNSDLTIKVFNPEPNIEHILFYKIEKNWREETLFKNEKTFRNLDFSFSYFVKTPFAVSDTFRVKIYELPAVKEIDLKYYFPKYTGLKPQILTDCDGNIKALKNTKVTISVTVNNPVEQAQIVFSEGKFKEMERLGKSSFKTSFSLRKSGFYHFKLKDVLGNEAEKIDKSITVVPDNPPEIQIVKPGKDTLLTQNMLFPLQIYAGDDFGLKNLKLKYFINAGSEDSIFIAGKIAEKILVENYTFDLSKMSLIPGDEVTYWTEVSDNSPENQKSESRRYLARFPSIEEIYREIEKEEQEKSEDMRNVLKKSQELQDEYEKKRRELMKKEKYDWQDKKELEKMLEKQQDMNKEIEKISEHYQDLIEKLKENKALSNETLEKMQKIQELMQEISNEDLQDAMKKLQEKMQKMNPDELQKAMKDFKFSMEEFSKKLDETIKMLQDIKKEQALQKALEISQEMERMQENLNEKTAEQSAENQKLAAEQKKISDKLENLKKQLQKSKEMLNAEKDKDVSEKMDELQQEMQRDSLANDLQQSEESLQNNEMQKAMKSQKSAAGKMKKTTQKISEMQQMMAGASMMEIGDAIEKTIKRLLIFSQKHETSAARYYDDPYAILPDQIAIYESIDLALKELYKTPMVFLFLGPKFIYDANTTSNSYHRFFQDVNDAKKYKIRQHLQEIQQGINVMIYDLMQAENNMQQQGGGSSSCPLKSLSQAMQQMGAQQMAINMLTRELMKQLGSMGKPSYQTRMNAQRLGRDEQRLAENLKRLLQTNSEAQKQTSAMNKIIEELEDISRDLQNNRIDQSLIDRQERILSRLLDAQKSIHKREYSRKRESELSDKKEWNLPNDLKLKFDKMKNKAFLNEEFKSYPKEYRDLILEYWKLLNEKANGMKN